MESDNILNAQWRKFGKWLAFSVLTIFIFYLLLYFVSKYITNTLFALPLYLLIIGIIFTGHTIFLLHKATFNFRTIYGFILFMFFVFITYICLILCSVNSNIFILYIPVIAMMLLLSNIKKTILLSAFTIIFGNYIDEISTYFNIGLPRNFYRDNEIILLIQQYLVIVISGYFTFLFLHFYVKIEKAKVEAKYNNEVFLFIKTENFQKKQPEESKEKYQKLYNSIIEILNEDKVYKDPDFNIRKLAELLNTNTTYVSKAMNLDGSKNFNQLINEYRINDVVSMMKNDNIRKYTIQYLYTQAGFSQQSTFNKIFKEYTGSTPSEYLEKLKNGKQILEEDL